MQFGRGEARGADFRLPPLDPRANPALTSATSRPLTVHIGCPAWTAKSWIGGLFPPDVKRPALLGEYSRRLSAVELNATFYAIPAPETVDRWRRLVPPGFRFCPKLPRQISRGVAMGRVHRRVLREFAAAIGPLGDRLGTCFLQLPPSVGPAERVALRELVAELSDVGLPCAVELRHPGLFRDGRVVDEVAELLRDHGLATVITDTAGVRDVVHATLTQPWVMIRFAGHHPHPSDPQRIDAWVQRIAEWREQGLERVYFFIHQPDDERGGPELCRYLAARLGAVCGLDLPTWRPTGQLPLFGSGNESTG